MCPPTMEKPPSLQPVAFTQFKSAHSPDHGRPCRLLHPAFQRGSTPGPVPRETRFIVCCLTWDASLAETRGMLPRKEVIQPQLPLRLPCYDFVPIIHPTLDGCLPCGLAHRLQVLPTFVT